MVVYLRLKYFDPIPTNTNQSCGGHSAVSLVENYANWANSTHISGLQKCERIISKNQENVELTEKVKLKTKMIMVTSE